MNISGGPEELATFIRTLNDEPIYFVQEPAKVQPVKLARPKPPPPSDGWVTPAVCVSAAAIFGAIMSYAALFGS